MELMDVINARRSVRAYKPDPVEKDKIEKVIAAAIMAPTGMNQQPWAFGVIQDAKVLNDISEKTRQFLLSKVDEWDWLARYAEYLADPGSNVFYHAPALVVIFAKNGTPLAATDCTLAAENMMLAARELGLGSCWIGFSGFVLNTPEAKKALGVPEDYVAIAPIILGYPAGDNPTPEKNPPEVMFWK